MSKGLLSIVYEIFNRHCLSGGVGYASIPYKIRESKLFRKKTR